MYGTPDNAVVRAVGGLVGSPHGSSTEHARPPTEQ